MGGEQLGRKEERRWGGRGSQAENGATPKSLKALGGEAPRFKKRRLGGGGPDIMSKEGKEAEREKQDQEANHRGG